MPANRYTKINSFILKMKIGKKGIFLNENREEGDISKYFSNVQQLPLYLFLHCAGILVLIWSV